jgi:hypothetical protein
MQRDILLLTEMVDAADQAGQLTAGITVSQLKPAASAVMPCCGNFTLLGEASSAASVVSRSGPRSGASSPR